MTIQRVIDLPQQAPDDISANLVAYKDTAVAFAVDVSASTRSGGILEAEKEGVQHLCRYLSTSAKNWTRILPWNSRQHSPLPLNRLSELRPFGGTNPAVLTYRSALTTPLQECSLWFLFTDGCIDESSVRSFAIGIGQEGFHGKACVIILYGDSWTYQNPLSCNISVGQAVFAIAPNCAFLFYDTFKKELIVMQCKGCFRKILPKADMEIILDGPITWDELPRTSYEELAKISIPRPHQVDLNTVILSNGQAINLEDLYKDRLSQAVATRIFENDDDLKSILLTAQTRGMNREIEQWISRQRIARNATEDLHVPDIDGEAFSLVSHMVDAMRTGNDGPSENIMFRKRLRDSHTRNALAHVQVVRSAEQRRSERNTVVDNALARVKLNRQSPGSPCTMSPVSPRPRTQSSRQNTPHIYHDRSYARYQPSPLPAQVPLQTMYTKGYSVGSGSIASECHCGECALCEDVHTPLALLLKAKPDDYSTEGDFPEAQSYQQVIFPLAMGNFPETDIISSFLCCERCAHFIRKLGYSPLDDKITGYIPLVSSKVETNRSSKRRALDFALEGRFDHSILDQIFLSILYSKLDEITGERNIALSPLINALRWECSNVTAQLSIPETISASFEPDLPATVGPLLLQLRCAFDTQWHGCSKLVTYPVDGFVTLMRITTDTRSDLISDGEVYDAVVQRFMYHLLEQQCLVRREDGEDTAAEELRRVLAGEVGGIDKEFFSADVETIVGTYLLDEETLDTFRRLGAPFKKLESEGGIAVRHFLQLLAGPLLDENKEMSPAEAFDMLVKKQTLNRLCETHFPLRATDYTQRKYQNQRVEQDAMMTDRG